MIPDKIADICKTIWYSLSRILAFSLQQSNTKCQLKAWRTSWLSSLHSGLFPMNFSSSMCKACVLSVRNV